MTGKFFMLLKSLLRARKVVSDRDFLGIAFNSTMEDVNKEINKTIKESEEKGFLDLEKIPKIDVKDTG